MADLDDICAAFREAEGALWYQNGMITEQGHGLLRRVGLTLP